MSGTNETETKKTLGLSRGGKLELKKTVDGGQVRQSFSHGRSKTVAVEVKKRRAVGAKADAEAPRPAETDLATDTLGHLTAEERALRLKVLEDAKRDEEQRRIHEAEERARKEQEAEEERKRAAAEALQPKKEEPLADAEKTIRGEPAAQVHQVIPITTTKQRVAIPGAAKPSRVQDDDEEENRARAKRNAVGKAAPKPATPAPRRGEQRRRTGKLTVQQALEGNEEERVRSLAAVKRARERERLRLLALARGEQQKILRDVVIPETITVQELANRMAERGADVIKSLMRMGIMATINQSLDQDTAEIIVTEFGHRVRRVSAADVEIGMLGEEDSNATLKPRPPVVTVMGHVDHGKTSLLDALRHTDVVASEAGGITQHIGAYQVTLPSKQKITFIDTPGHAAFTEMRARGATVTDIVVLVVAADDGIKEQTVEAIRHARAAQVPIIVAINKIDKPGANPDRVRQELLNHELVPEQLGGDIQTVEVSAKARLNLDKLEEAILLQAEILELKANPDRAAQGTVIEARLERGRGSVATLLVQRGTLKVGDIFVAGSEWGRVRALINDHGANVVAAEPSSPVEVLGLQGTPQAGDDFVVMPSESRAREIAEFRSQRQREKQATASSRGTLEQMFSKIAAGEVKELPVILKSDVQGSLEAIASSLAQLSTNEVAVKVLHSAVGGITETDVALARASDAIIIGFNVRANPQARELARRDKIDIRYYSIIYNVVDDMKALLGGLLSPVVRENFLGNAEIREVFNITKVGKVAGCMITEGVVKRGAKVRLLRDNVVIHEGSLRTLKRFKDEVREVKEGFECGMAFENYHDIQVGDIIECFDIEQIARTLE